jgi:MoxR-like ATPase
MPTEGPDTPRWRRLRPAGADDVEVVAAFEPAARLAPARSVPSMPEESVGVPSIGGRDTSGDSPWAVRAGGPMEPVLYEVKKAIVGQDRLLERLLVALLARGHILVEGVPGLAKTLAVKSLAQAISCEFQRVQFTPDLVPGDLLGTRIYHQPTGEFRTSLGPVFTNLLLADEINRAPAKVQSALLEVMQEQQVTIARESKPLADPFLVLATQNPIESEGTYALPEAQLDRFMMKVAVDYPSPTEEFVVVERMMSPTAAVQSVLSTAELLAAQRQADRVYVDPALIEFAVRLAGATRGHATAGLGEFAKYVDFGVSPRGPINLILAARALAYVRGRDYALPDDVLDLAHEVFRHRMVLSFEALADGVTADVILDRAVAAAAAPTLVRTRA